MGFCLGGITQFLFCPRAYSEENVSINPMMRWWWIIKEKSWVVWRGGEFTFRQNQIKKIGLSSDVRLLSYDLHTVTNESIVRHHILTFHQLFHPSVFPIKSKFQLDYVWHDMLQQTPWNCLIHHDVTCLLSYFFLLLLFSNWHREFGPEVGGEVWNFLKNNNKTDDNGGGD